MPFILCKVFGEDMGDVLIDSNSIQAVFDGEADGSSVVTDCNGREIAVVQGTVKELFEVVKQHNL